MEIEVPSDGLLLIFTLISDFYTFCVMMKFYKSCVPFLSSFRLNEAQFFHPAEGTLALMKCYFFLSLLFQTCVWYLSSQT